MTRKQLGGRKCQRRVVQDLWSGALRGNEHCNKMLRGVRAWGQNPKPHIQEKTHPLSLSYTLIFSLSHSSPTQLPFGFVPLLSPPQQEMKSILKSFGNHRGFRPGNNQRGRERKKGAREIDTEQRARWMDTGQGCSAFPDRRVHSNAFSPSHSISFSPFCLFSIPIPSLKLDITQWVARAGPLLPHLPSPASLTPLWPSVKKWWSST